MDFILGLYATVTILYPPAYRARFRQEMLDVFQEALLEAENCGRKQVWWLIWRELRDLPGVLVRAHMEFIMAEQTVEKPTPWREVVLGAFLFLAGGLYLIWNEIPHDWFGGALSNREASVQPTMMAVFIGIHLLLPAAGLCLGYLKGFPRWSYPYVGTLFVMSLYMSVLSTPGLYIFNAEVFGGRRWGLGAFLPLLVALLIAIWVTRSLKPFIQLFSNAWEDWTVLTFAIFGFTPLLISIAFDEIDRLYSLYFMVFLTVVMLVTVVLYLRSTVLWQRATILLTSVGVVIAKNVAVPALYWQQSGVADVIYKVVLSMFALTFFFSPLFLGLLHYLGSMLLAGED
jgi:hypothetical protein